MLKSHITGIYVSDANYTSYAFKDIEIGWAVVDVVFIIPIWQDLISLTKLIVTHAI